MCACKWCMCITCAYHILHVCTCAYNAYNVCNTCVTCVMCVCMLCAWMNCTEPLTPAFPHMEGDEMGSAQYCSCIPHTHSPTLEKLLPLLSHAHIWRFPTRVMGVGEVYIMQHESIILELLWTEKDTFFCLCTDVGTFTESSAVHWCVGPMKCFSVPSLVT